MHKEIQAIKRLCGPDTHVNIVQVLNHGHLSNPIFYFIDMELCDSNLHDYIYRKDSNGPSKPMTSVLRGAGLNLVLQIWTIMSQIAAGVEYIHEQRHVHRDLKPANGLALRSITDAYSSILEQRFAMETGRFWADCRRLVEDKLHNAICKRNTRLQSP